MNVITEEMFTGAAPAAEETQTTTGGTEPRNDEEPSESREARSTVVIVLASGARIEFPSRRPAVDAAEITSRVGSGSALLFTDAELVDENGRGIMRIASMYPTRDNVSMVGWRS